MSKLNKLLKYIEANKPALRRQGLEVHDNHKPLVNRRDLLSAGFYASAYSLAMPTIGNLLLASSEARGADDIACQLDVNSCGVPFAQINFSGGRNLWGHGIMLGMKADGQPQDFGSGTSTDYFNYGAPPDLHPSKFTQLMMGGHPFLPYHYMYTSALQAFGTSFASIDADMTIMSFCARSPDDSGSTLQNMLPSVAKLRGSADFQIASNGSGTNLSGINALPAFVGVEQNTSVVSNPDISSLLATGLPESASADVKKAYMDTLYKLVSERIPDETVKNFFCSREAAKKKLETFSQSLNPFTMTGDPIATELINHFPEDSNNGSIAYMLATGLALSGGINRGGYDYHNQTSDGYIKDFNAFVGDVWPLVSYFHAVGKPLLLLLTSDGSTRTSAAVDPRDIMIAGQTDPVTTPLGANNGDGGRHGGAVLIALNPGKGRLDLGRGHQVGHGTPQGIAGDPSNPIGNYASGNYQKVLLESIRRLMVRMSDGSCNMMADFQEASGGLRFEDNLSTLVPKDA
ncbi:MAG: hypothetical protein AB8G05_17235 [Oligoflexales bacterium]